MNPLQPFLAWLSRRRAKRIAAREEHRRQVIISQIANRKRRHKAHVPLLGSLKDATTAALRADVQGRA